MRFPLAYCPASNDTMENGVARMRNTEEFDCGIVAEKFPSGIVDLDANLSI
jgi:hypothetical protein